MKTYNPAKKNVIYVYDNDINKALSILKHETAPLMKELKLKRFFESNTEKRRRKQKEAIIKNRQKMKKLEMYW